MRLVCDYNTLVSCVDAVSVVVEDTMTSEDAKNIIIRVTGDEVKFIGVSAAIVYRRTLEPEAVSIEEPTGEDTLVQLKSKDFRGFLNSYKNTRRMKVEQVTLDFKAPDRVECVVLERKVDKNAGQESMFGSFEAEDSENTTRRSRRYFKVTRIRPAMLKDINAPSPSENLESYATVILQGFLQNTLPIIASGNTVYSRLWFGEDYVVANSGAFMTLLKNKLVAEGHEAFRGICLMHRVVAFLDKMIATEEEVSAYRDKQTLYIKAGYGEAFVRYASEAPQYKVIKDSYSRESGVTFDRLDFKDILRRFAMSQDSIMVSFDIENNQLVLSNTDSTQTIDLNFVKNMDAYSGQKFKIMPEVLNKAIIGVDEKFINPDVAYGEDVFLYICLSPNGQQLLYLSDCNNFWFSSVNVKFSK